MTKKQVKELTQDTIEKIDALHKWEKEEGFEPTDFAGDVDEIEMRYAQLMDE